MTDFFLKLPVALIDNDTVSMDAERIDIVFVFKIHCRKQDFGAHLHPPVNGTDCPETETVHAVKNIQMLYFSVQVPYAADRLKLV